MVNKAKTVTISRVVSCPTDCITINTMGNSVANTTLAGLALASRASRNRYIDIAMVIKSSMKGTTNILDGKPVGLVKEKNTNISNKQHKATLDFILKYIFLRFQFIKYCGH